MLQIQISIKIVFVGISSKTTNNVEWVFFTKSTHERKERPTLLNFCEPSIENKCRKHKTDSFCLARDSILSSTFRSNFIAYCPISNSNTLRRLYILLENHQDRHMNLLRTRQCHAKPSFHSIQQIELEIQNHLKFVI